MRNFLSINVTSILFRQRVFIDNGHGTYPYLTDVSDISDLIREYIDTPVSELMTRWFDNDRWGLTDILRAADRRIGKRRLEQLKETASTDATRVVTARIKKRKRIPIPLFLWRKCLGIGWIFQRE